MPLLGQYEYIIDKSHQRANADGCVYAHMIVAEQKLGRPLLPKEFVHHKDLNKLNNDPNNIMVFATNSDHVRFHNYGCDESMLSLNSNGAYVCLEKKHYCIDCGTEVSNGVTRCLSCARIHSRKVERPTSDELFNLLSSLNGNFVQAGKKYGVTDNTVRKWCNSYGIPSKSSQYKPEKTKQLKEDRKLFDIGIIQLDKETDKEINRFDNVSSVMKYLGVSDKYKFHIIDVCKGKQYRKSAYGYKWKFI